ncbi:hypothetical protein NDU88_008649 [Pleurodeles waltl]|uniref:Uncharacterized protein n=1 Tax=Pleurodeles waltl TaxID=8319 RepID=A0AAV7QV47_PLEWA|nr:hypothetical protein NDU88_008649 [Pleurodeles waltl]
MGRRRISLVKLQMTAEQGGMGAPDFKAYFIAGQLQRMAYWLAGRNLHEIELTQSIIDRGRLHCLICPGFRTPEGLPLLLRVALQYWTLTLRYNTDTIPYASNIPLLELPTNVGILS